MLFFCLNKVKSKNILMDENVYSIMNNNKKKNVNVGWLLCFIPLISLHDGLFKINKWTSGW